MYFKIRIVRKGYAGSSVCWISHMARVCSTQNVYLTCTQTPTWLTWTSSYDTLQNTNSNKQRCWPNWISGSRAAAEQSDPELRLFRRILRRRRDVEVLSSETARFYILFYLLPSRRSFVPCTSWGCCELDLSPSFAISSISRARGGYRFPSLDYLPGRVVFDLFDPLRISSLGYENGSAVQAAAR